MVHGLPQRGVIFSAALVLAALSFALPASAQAVLQAGPILNGGGHAPMYLYSSPQGLATVMDSGAAGGGPIGYGLSEKLLQARGPGTGPDGTHDCDWSTYATNPAGAAWLCFDPLALGGGLLDYNSPSGAPLQFKVNGTLYKFPFVVSPSASNAGIFPVGSFGAVCDGVTDDHNAINLAIAAAAASGGTVQFPATPCYTTQPIIYGKNVHIAGVAFFPGNPPAGSGLICATGNAICLQSAIPGNATGTSQIDNMVIRGVPGIPVSGSIGVEWAGGYNIRATNVMAYNFDTCVEWLSNATYGGISFHGTAINAGACKSKFFVQDGWPELYLENGRLGMDGLGDFSQNKAFVLTNTGCTGAGCGPNSLAVTNYQINPGSGTGMACGVSWENFSHNPQTTIFKFVNTHWEGFGNGDAMFCSDATVPVISKLRFTDNEVGQDIGPAHVFALNAATSLQDSSFDGNWFAMTDMTLNQPQLYNVTFASNGEFPPVNSITGNSGTFDRLALIGNHYDGSLTLAGSNWFSLSVIGEDVAGGLTCTATGNVSVIGGQVGTTSCPGNRLTSQLTIDQTPAPTLTFRAANPGSGVGIYVSNDSNVAGSQAQVTAETYPSPGNGGAVAMVSGLNFGKIIGTPAYGLGIDPGAPNGLLNITDIPTASGSLSYLCWGAGGQVSGTTVSALCH